MIQVLRWIALIGIGALATAVLVSGGEAPEESGPTSDEHLQDVADEAVGIVGGRRYPWNVNNLRFWADVVEDLLGQINDLSSVIYYLQSELDDIAKERKQDE